MNEEKLKKQLGANIASFRKREGMTQAVLGEKLNFSDKAVSKWERGESVPDVLTLMALAEVFGVTVDDLLRDHNALPADVGMVEQVMGKAVEKTLKRKANKRIIAQLCSVLVWFVALFIYVICASVGVPKSWIAFFYAIPVNCIVLLSLRSAWRDFRSNKWLISGIVWGFLVSVYVSVLVFAGVNKWLILLLGIPGQIAIILWFRLRKGEDHREQKASSPKDTGAEETAF